MLKLKIWFFAILIFVTFGCKNNNNNPDNSVVSTKLHSVGLDLKIQDTSFTKICFANPYKTNINLIFQINHNFWFSKHQLIHDILNQDIRNIARVDEKIYKAWVFMILNTAHQPPLDLEPDELNNPLVLFNSIGSGFCYNRAVCLAQLWSALGFRSRIIHLGGHAVPEVYDHDKWKMLDPDNGIYFTDSSGTIASVEEIAVSANSLIIDTIMAYDFTQLLNILVNKDSFIDLFTSTKNNVTDTSGTTYFYPEQTCLSLPPFAKLEFPVHNSLADRNSSYSFCRLTVPLNYTGLINIPFIIHHIEGHGFLINDKRIIVPPKNKKPYPAGLYYLCCDSLKIYAYINPLLLNFNQTNEIQLFSFDRLFPSVSFGKNETTVSSFYKLRKNQNRALLLQYIPYIQFFLKWPETENINISNLHDLNENIYYVYKNTVKNPKNKKTLDAKINSFIQRIEKENIDKKILYNTISDAALFKLLSIAIIESLPCNVEKYYLDALILKLRIIQKQKNSR